MKFNLSISEALIVEVNKELKYSQEKFDAGRLQESWRHLERAHILGQQSPYQHTRVHWAMMHFAFRIKNLKEILGQIPRLLVGGVKSFVGEIPVGNTGGANVPALQPMEIPNDLKELIKQHS